MKKTKKNGRYAAAAALLAAVSFLTAGCAPKKAEAIAAGAKKLKKLVLPLDRTSIGIINEVLAYELKYFEEGGLDVEFQPLNTSGVNMSQLAAVSTGKVDLANSTGTTAPLLFIEQGNDLAILGGTMAEGAALIVRPENTANYGNFTPDSLYGKKIGAIRANTGDVALRGWLARQGADLSRITFVELDSAATILEAVRKGELDVGNIFTIWRLKAEEQGLPVVLHIDTLVPNFPCCRISTTRTNVNARRDDYVAFLRGLIKAYKFFNEEQEKSLDIAVKYFDLDRESLRANYYTYGHFQFHPDPARKRILEFYAGMTAVGYAKGVGDVQGHIDVSLYRDALDQVLAEYPGDIFYLEMKRYFEENN